MLPTSSGKSALFFSVAAMTHQQTVIVVVPFAALVDDIIERGRVAGLHCEEWMNERSGHELQQLIVVSADRAVHGQFLHYAKGLELEGHFRRVPCRVHGHIIPGAVTGVVDIAIFRLPAHGVNGDIDGGFGRHIKGAVVYRQRGGIPAEHGTKDDPISGKG